MTTTDKDLGMCLVLFESLNTMPPAPPILAVGRAMKNRQQRYIIHKTCALQNGPAFCILRRRSRWFICKWETRKRIWQRSTWVNRAMLRTKSTPYTLLCVVVWGSANGRLYAPLHIYHVNKRAIPKSPRRNIIPINSKCFQVPPSRTDQYTNIPFSYELWLIGTTWRTTYSWCSFNWSIPESSGELFVLFIGPLHTVPAAFIPLVGPAAYSSRCRCRFSRIYEVCSCMHGTLHDQ